MKKILLTITIFVLMFLLTTFSLQSYGDYVIEPNIYLTDGNWETAEKIYNPENSDSEVQGASYDKNTRTLTIQNVNSSKKLSITNPGTDFILNVEGNNSLGGFSAISMGGDDGQEIVGVYITGTGTLTIDTEEDAAIALGSYFGGSTLRIGKDVTLNLKSKKDVITVSTVTEINRPTERIKFDNNSLNIPVENSIYKANVNKIIEAYYPSTYASGVSYLGERVTKTNSDGIYTANYWWRDEDEDGINEEEGYTINKWIWVDSVGYYFVDSNFETKEMSVEEFNNSDYEYILDSENEHVWLTNSTYLEWDSYNEVVKDNNENEYVIIDTQVYDINEIQELPGKYFLTKNTTVSADTLENVIEEKVWENVYNYVVEGTELTISPTNKGISTVFTASNEGNLTLRQDGKALIYTMEEVQYEITVREVQSTEPLVEDLMNIAYRTAPNNDYIASELVNYSNMYLRVDAIATQAHPDVSENDIFLEVAGQPIELTQGYSTKSLAQLLEGTNQPENDCLNVYIRKAYNNQGDPGNPGNPGGGENNDNISIVFDNATISGNTVSFVLDENTTITSTVNGANISNDNNLVFSWSDLNNVSFTLSENYDNDKMCVIVRGKNGYNGLLKVTGSTATFEGLNLPDGGLHFSIEYKQGDPGDPNNPGNPGGHPDIDYSSLSNLNIIIENMAIESKMFYGFDGTANIKVPQEQNYGIDMTTDTLCIRLETDITSKTELFELYQLNSGEVHGEADMELLNEKIHIDVATLMSGGEISIPINPSERYLIKVRFHSHDLHEIIEDTVVKKATLNEDGIINRSIQNTCILCGDVVGGRGETFTIYHPQTIALSKTSYIYNGKEQKPTAIIKDTQGNIIDSSNYTITYSSGCKNVGTYKATVTFKSKYEGTKELSFKINKATYDMSKVKFENKSVTYNGKNQSLKATGLPAGVKVTYTNNGKKKIGEYKVIAKFTGDTTNYNAIPNKTAKLTIVPKGTSLKKLTKGSKQFKATWKAQKTETTGYELQYATNSKFTSGKKTVNIKKNKTTSSTVKKLKAKKKYYVRIRTYKTVNGKKYYSGWSKVLNVKTK